MLAHTFRDGLLPILLPSLEARLNHPEWKIKETGILVVGTIAEGCTPGMADKLDLLCKDLIPALVNEKPLVRAQACWALSRYTDLFLSEIGIKHLHQLIPRLVDRVCDRNERVQESACNAVAVIQVRYYRRFHYSFGLNLLIVSYYLIRYELMTVKISLANSLLLTWS